MIKIQRRLHKIACLRNRKKKPYGPFVYIGSYFSWIDWKKLFWNFLGFLLLAALLQFAEMTKLGQEALDSGFDFLIKNNYEWAVLDKNEQEPVSQDFRFVIFDERTYKRSYTKGYWTPRDILGLTILRVIQRGASVVLVDFNFRDDAPIVLNGETAIDGTSKFISYLKETAELCRQKKSVVILPTLQPGVVPNRHYLQIIMQYPDVFRMANFKAERDSYDQHVRRFVWYEYNHDYAPVLSANLLTLLTLKKDFQLSVREQSEAKAHLLGLTPSTHFLPPKLVESLRQDSRKVSSRIIFRLLPRTVVAREFKGGDNVLRGITWDPTQVIEERFSNPDFTGKVVLIGSDFHENGDYHTTVFGSVAGSYLLANCVNMVLTNNIPQEKFIINFLVMCSIGFIFCFLYSCFRSIIVNCSIIIISFFSPLISSFAFNNYGLFIDVWIPLLGIGAYNTIADFVQGKNILDKLKIWRFFSKKYIRSNHRKQKIV